MLSRLQPQELKLGMEVDNISRRWQMQFGIKITSGVVVIDVVPNSPVDLAGIQVGDVITEINRKSVENVNDYKSILEQVEKRGSILFLINRGG